MDYVDVLLVDDLWFGFFYSRVNDQTPRIYSFELIPTFSLLPPQCPIPRYHMNIFPIIRTYHVYVFQTHPISERKHTHIHLPTKKHKSRCAKKTMLKVHERQTARMKTRSEWFLADEPHLLVTESGTCQQRMPNMMSETALGFHVGEYRSFDDINQYRNDNINYVLDFLLIIVNPPNTYSLFVGGRISLVLLHSCCSIVIWYSILFRFLNPRFGILFFFSSSLFSQF